MKELPSKASYNNKLAKIEILYINEKGSIMPNYKEGLNRNQQLLFLEQPSCY